MQGATWDMGLIPESLDSFIESLVQQMNRGRFRFELGKSCAGPCLSRVQAQSYDMNRLQDNRKHVTRGCPSESFHSTQGPIRATSNSPFINLDTGLDSFSNTNFSLALVPLLRTQPIQILALFLASSVRKPKNQPQE